MSSPLRTALERHRVMAIVRGTQAAAAAATTRALLEAGIRLVEVTLTTPGALDIIEELAATCPFDAIVGAGTVTTRRDVADVLAAGGRFVVTPCPAEAIEAAVSADLPVAAGAFTPGEIHDVHARGADVVKVFPASAVGPGYLRAVADPFPRIPLMAVGGVDARVAADYLEAGAVGLGVGSPLVGDAARGGDVEAVRERAAAFLRAVTPQ